ncbi:MAG: hypothetical protein WA705_00435 [Candidatus Ozemobacteraceae bacterium]
MKKFMFRMSVVAAMVLVSLPGIAATPNPVASPSDAYLKELKSGLSTTTAASRFTKEANGVVTDKTTGLQWFALRESDGRTCRKMNWYDTDNWARNLKVGKAGSGWRIPTRTQLRTLPAGLPELGYPLPSSCWADFYNGTQAWTFVIGVGHEVWESVDCVRFALAVRADGFLKTLKWKAKSMND